MPEPGLADICDDNYIPQPLPPTRVSAQKSSRKTPVLLILSACIAAATSSCSNVKPFQRGYLAEYVMRLNKDPLARSMADHMYFSREGAHGGGTVGGGGCGCN